MEELFYLACLRDNVGSNVAFHGKKSGYVTDLDQAEVLTREQAQSRWNSLREFDLPLSKRHVDSLSVSRVDFQYLPGMDSIVEDDYDEYVIFKKHMFNGNDVYWITKSLSLSDKFTDAFIFPKLSASHFAKREDLIVLPYKIVDKLKRRTFDSSLINKRVMTQAAGIKTPDHIKKQNRRKGNSGLNRNNCEKCGRFTYKSYPYGPFLCNSCNPNEGYID